MTSLEEDFWRFVDEREAIRLRRADGMGWPWTTDPVLRTHHFTNVRRGDDPGTVFIVEVLRGIEHHGSPRWDLLLTAYLYRGLNRPSTFETYGLPWPEDLEVWFDLLHDAKDRGEKLGSRWHQTFFDRYERHAYDLVGNDELADAVFGASDGQRAVKALVDADIGLGPFFGIQIVADLAEARVGTAFGRDTMMPVSAGSRIGLQLIDGTMDPRLLDDRTYERSGAGRWTRRLQIDGPEQARIAELVAARPDLRLTPIDIEHVLCEFGKYWMIHSGAPAGARRSGRLQRSFGMSETTFAWLIERGSEYGYAVPVYWAEFRWTTEAHKAMRFATREEAQSLVDRAARTATGLPWGDVTEHGFVEFVRP